MRTLVSKKNFTRAERVMVRLLQENHIPFKAKVKIQNLEVDFLIGKIAIEIDGHAQTEGKNNVLVELGYYPLHFQNKEILQGRNKVINIINNLRCL